MPKMKSYATFELFRRDQAAGHRRVISALEKLVAKRAPTLTKSVKWGNGVWLKGDAPVLFAHCEEDHVVRVLWWRDAE